MKTDIYWKHIHLGSKAFSVSCHNLDITYYIYARNEALLVTLVTFITPFLPRRAGKQRHELQSESKKQNILNRWWKKAFTFLGKTSSPIPYPLKCIYNSHLHEPLNFFQVMSTYYTRTAVCAANMMTVKPLGVKKGAKEETKRLPTIHWGSSALSCRLLACWLQQKLLKTLDVW